MTLYPGLHAHHMTPHQPPKERHDIHVVNNAHRSDQQADCHSTQ